MITGETALEFILSLKPALPMSKEKPCTVASGSEIRRWFSSSSIMINGKRIKHDELIDFPVISLVFFPKGESRCTLF